jgi:Ca-activated chloride channel homolog
LSLDAGSSIGETIQLPLIRINVDLTLVNATVTSRDGQNIQGLKAENFQLWEDKVEQKIEYFSIEDIPATIGLVFDVSSSMTTQSPLAREALATFLETSNRQDEYFLVEFNSRPHLIEDFTTDIDRIEQRVSSTEPTGSTALYDAVRLAVEKLRNGHRMKKALLLISDGQDNASRYGFLDTVEYVKEQDVQIYAIGTFVDRYSARRMMHRSGEGVLTGLAEVTGGEVLFPKSTRELPDVCRTIAQELRNQYLIGYRSTNQRADGKWRKIRMKVNPPKDLSRVTVRAKSGYYAPRIASIH